ncbi:hypothetical protein BBP40_008769 [Aspergillus hancockii]|nr:hypothetical protein BBP40_008769 [Aspergillus hancockii]
MKPALTSLEVAAQYPPFESETFDIPDETIISTLSTSSPVHHAIAAGKRAMLNYLLVRNHSPNYRPRAAPTVALPPLSYVTARCAKIHRRSPHPRLNPHIRTLIFNVHPLHFAAAQHDPDFLSWLAASVGCLTTVVILSLATPLLPEAYIARVHLVLSRPRIDYQVPFTCSSRLWGSRVEVTKPLMGAEQVTQRVTIKLLLGCSDVREQDVDGNMALHCLAGTLNIDEETIEMLRGMDGGEEVWDNAEKLWGV